MTARHRLQITLILTVICLVAVLSYFILSSHRANQHASSSLGQTDGCVGDAIVIKGFRQTVAEGARTIYELWASKATLKIETKEYSLERVLPASTYFGKEGRHISFSADEGIYDPHSDNVILRRNVTAMLSTGLTLKCDKISFSRSTMTASSHCPVVVTGEGIYFQTRGFSVNLPSREILFPSVVHLKTRSSPPKFLRFFEKDAESPGLGATLKDSFALSAEQMLVHTKKRTAELVGDVALKFGQDEIMAAKALFAWGDELREIRWAELRGNVVIKSQDGAIGCAKAEYRDDVLVLQGKPLLIHGFAQLATTNEARSIKPGETISWPTLFSSYQSRQRAAGQAYFLSTREKFNLLRSAARYLGCSTLDAAKMTYKKVPNIFSASDGVVLSLAELPGLSSASSISPKVSAETLEADLGERRALFRGDVHVVSGHNSIRADALAVRIRGSDKEGLEIQSLDFAGSVKANVWAPSRSNNGSQAAESRPGELLADKLSVNVASGKAHCSGDVSVHWQDRSLRCKRLNIAFLEGMSGLDWLVARDDVVLETQGRIATGGKFVLEGASQVATLTRQPKVWYSENVIAGRKVLYQLKTGDLSIIDNVTGVFYNQKELKMGNGGAEDKKGSLDKSESLSVSESLRRPGKIELCADRFDYNEKTMQGSYSGGVVLRKGDSVFSADTIKMSGDPASGQIGTLEAEGNVRVQDGTKVLRAEKVLYYDDEQKVVLFGMPKMFELGRIITRGKVVTLYLGKREYEIEGEEKNKIKTTFFVPNRQ